MRLRARWRGPLPEPGDILRSAPRPRYAYVITAAISTPSEDGITFCTFEVERIPAADAPTGARTWDWAWDSRGRARRTSS